MSAWMFWGCMPFLAAALLTDVRTMKIPNVLTVSAALSGLLVRTGVQGITGLAEACAGLLAGFALLLVLHIFGAVGAGDVKLFAAIGAWTGIPFTLRVLVYSIALAAAAGFILWMWRRAQRPAKIPFMLAVFPAVLFAYFYY